MPKPVIGIVDFFCGAGGVSAGAQLIRSQRLKAVVLGGIDNDPHSCKTFERNHNAPAICSDIRHFADKPEELRDVLSAWGAKKCDHLIFVGCAPCQGFAAHRKSQGGRDERRTLLRAFSQIIAEHLPDGIFAENVPDLLSQKYWRYFSAFRSSLTQSGYSTKASIFNFANFGLPQERFRAVVFASRSSNVSLPVPPVPDNSFSTVRDAISCLPEITPGEPCPADPMHITSNHRPSTIRILSAVPKDGGNRPVGVGPKCLDEAREKHGGYTDVYGRLPWDKPSVTITARCRTPSCGRFAHPEQNRGLSVREAALLQGFPSDFYFEGPFDDKFKQVGNAVPPIAAKHLLKCLCEQIAGKTTSLTTDPEIDTARPVGSGFAVKINGIKRARVAAAAGRDVA